MIGTSYRFQLGAITAVVICDADQRRNAAHLWPDVAEDARESSLRQLNFQPNNLTFSINILVLKTREGLVLVDCGLGAGLSELPHHLVTAGFELNRVRHVITTHAHRDHIGGLVSRDGSLTFPHARYYWFEGEWEHALAQAQGTDDGAIFLQHILPLLHERLTVIQHDGEFLPGIHAVEAPGHTPGHLALLIESQGERLLHLADSLNHPVQVTRPDWEIVFDSDKALAVQTRRSLLQRAASERLLTLAYHFPFPGLGRVEAAGDELRWLRL